MHLPISWLIMKPFCYKGEAFGYYGRAWSHESPKLFDAFVLQSLLILVAPPLLAATIYMTLSRIIRALDAEAYSLIRTKWLTTIFVLADVVCFLTQLGGAGIKITGDPQILKIGRILVLSGLSLQIIVFAWFVMVVLKLHLRLNRKPTMLSSDPELSSWRSNMWAMYLVSMAVFVRNLVRVVEYGQGTHGFIMKHEAMLYIFDAFLMFLIVFIFVLVHPGRFLRKAYRVKKTFSRSSMVQLVDNQNKFVPGERQEGEIQ